MADVNIDRCTTCRSDQHNTMVPRVNGQRQRCHACRKQVDGYRVYFGVVGPFCCVPCRDRWNDANIAAGKAARAAAPSGQTATKGGGSAAR